MQDEASLVAKSRLSGPLWQASALGVAPRRAWAGPFPGGTSSHPVVMARLARVWVTVQHWSRPALVGVSGGLSIAILVVGASFAAALAADPAAMRGYGGVDFNLYRDATARWLIGGAFYPSAQLAGAYALPGAILYPPVALWLFAPFTVLPALLWWAIPLGATGWAIVRMRPGPLAWPLMAACLAAPVFHVKVLTGNPVLWVQAAVALGCLYSWPAVLVLIKPSLAPLALIGANRRSWMRALVIIGLVSLPFGAMWVDWITSMLNLEGGDLLYSLMDWPLVALPLAAWAERQVTRFVKGLRE